MITRLLLALFALALAQLRLSAAETAEPDEPGPLEFKRLDLLDGRRLKDVTVRTYDPRTDKALLLAGKKAMTVPVELIPEPFATQVRQDVPKAGSSVSDTSPRPPPSSGHGSTPPRPTPRPPRQPAPPPVAPQDDLVSHRAAATDRARTYYRYEYKVGSDAIRVTSVRIDARVPEAITGWPGRYRTQGTAYLDVFDTKGWSATRATSTFEVVTEQKPNEPVVVLDFTRKS